MPRLTRRLSHSTPPSITSSRYLNDDRHDRYASPRGQRRPVRKSRSRAPSVDSDDTYYDPRDRFYLSGDEDNEKSIPRRGREPPHSRHSRPPSPNSSAYSSRSSSPEGYYTHRPRRPSAVSRSPSPYRHHPPRSSASRVPDRERQRNHNHPSSRAHNRTRSEAPRKSRARSRSRSRSRDRNASYPRRRNRHSRSRSRSRSRSISPYYTSGDSRSASPSPTRSKPKSALTIAQEAAHHAFEAGAIAALRLRNDPSPWLGKKGGQIAAAAIGAAVVDTFVARRIPKRKGGLRHSVARQAAQMVIGGLVSPSQDGKGAKGKVNGAKGRMKGAVRTGGGARGRR